MPALIWLCAALSGLCAVTAGISFNALGFVPAVFTWLCNAMTFGLCVLVFRDIRRARAMRATARAATEAWTALVQREMGRIVERQRKAVEDHLRHVALVSALRKTPVNPTSTDRSTDPTVPVHVIPSDIVHVDGRAVYSIADVLPDLKRCGNPACLHWDSEHPNNGPCTVETFEPDDINNPEGGGCTVHCLCTGFVEPAPVSP